MFRDIEIDSTYQTERIRSLLLTLLSFNHRAFFAFTVKHILHFGQGFWVCLLLWVFFGGLCVFVVVLFFFVFWGFFCWFWGGVDLGVLGFLGRFFVRFLFVLLFVFSLSD